MGLTELVARALADVRIDDAMAQLARIAEHDRYQASLGIERAADDIASAARAIGLEASIEYFEADGRTAWWTFQAPRAWTPTTARLEVAGLVLDHAVQPFTIATYSAPARVTARIASDDGDVAGSIVVIRDLARLDTLAARGAIGFITDATNRCGLPGRIELPLDTPLFGFSVTPDQRAAIETAREASVHVEVDRSARMPVVTAVLPGRGAGEVWFTSHLCHPRPGANDNASGAAALLGVAAVLRGRSLERSVRFVWGPEFLGVAAMLHTHARRPDAVINLDMVGEDPEQCGIPLVVERAPEWCASLLTPVAEAVVEEVFAQTSAHAGSWRPGLFYGFSDHALFANVLDASARRPAVQLWHPGDPFNHSAADTLDKVSAVELSRAIAAGAAIAEAVDGAVPLGPIVERWCDRELGAGADPRLVEDMRALVDAGPTACVSPRPSAGAFAGKWKGPFNYRALLGDLSATDRDGVVALFLADKRNYAVLTHLAMLADRCASREEAIAAASRALRYRIEPAVGDRLWAALLSSGWL